MWKVAFYQIFFLLLGCSQSYAQKPIILMHDFHITEGGGFINKTVREMSTEEFQYLVTVGCTVLGGSCKGAAASAREAFEFLSEAITSAGGNYSISGRLLEHGDGSEEWRGIFEPMDGYEVCSAALNYGDMSITGETTFNVTVHRSPWSFRGQKYEGLSFYAVVPKNRQTRQWVNANFVITYVPTGAAGDYDCQADHFSPWLCKGQSCDPLTRYQQRQGWIYVGRDMGDGQWIEPRSQDMLGISAPELRNLELKLNRDVNLRDGPFRLNPGSRCGQIESNIIGSLVHDTNVKVKRIVPFENCTSFIWAEVEEIIPN